MKEIAVNITLVLTRDLLERIEQARKDTGQNRSEFIRDLIEEALNGRNN